MSKRDYYEILGVSRTSTDQEIKSAYRRLALKFHPDRNPGDKTAEDNFKEAAEAYAVLVDTDKRHMYDRFGHAGLGGAATGGFDPNAFSGFEDILGGLGDIFGFGDVVRRRARGEAARSAAQTCATTSRSRSRRRRKAARRRIQIPRQETCETCKGNGAAPGTSAGRPVRSARVAGSSAISRDSSRLRGPADNAGARARSSPSRVTPVAAPDAFRRRRS